MFLKANQKNHGPGTCAKDCNLQNICGQILLFYYSTIIRSLSKHIEEFRICLKSKQFDIISVNEAMLDNLILDENAVHGSELVRKDRNCHGIVGVLLYIFD